MFICISSNIRTYINGDSAVVMRSICVSVTSSARMPVKLLLLLLLLGKPAHKTPTGMFGARALRSRRRPQGVCGEGAGSRMWQGPPRLCVSTGRGDATSLAMPPLLNAMPLGKRWNHFIHMGNLLGWLETRLVQVSFNYLKIANVSATLLSQ